MTQTDLHPALNLEETLTLYLAQEAYYEEWLANEAAEEVVAVPEEL